MFKQIGSDRRLWLVGLLALLVWVVSRHVVSIDTAMMVVVKSGYWVLLIVLGLLGATLVKLTKGTFPEWRPSRGLAVGALVISTCWGIWLAQEPQGYKILSDELLLTGTSMSMHYDRQVAYPVRASDVQGPFILTQRVLDKRPFFFPVLVSLVHDVTGYRPANAFYVNMFLGLGFLGMVYSLGRKLARNEFAGIFGVVLFAGLPLMAIQTTGAGFELLNLVMIMAVLLLGMRYANRPDENSATALSLAALLLAYARYESVVFLLPVACLLVWGWVRAGRVILTLPMMLSPLVLAPYLLQNRIFSSNGGAAWELAGQPGATEPFGFQYLPGNLGHALAFFFDTSGYQPNSILFGALGLLALPFFVLWMKRVLTQKMQREPSDVAVAMVGAGLCLVGVLLMVYFWGQFDHPVIRRLSLPVHLLMAIALLIAGAGFFKTGRGWKWACGLAVAALLVQGLPWMSRRAYAADYSPGVEMAWRWEFLKRYPAKDYLFIDRDIVFWITQRIPATPIKQAHERKEGLAFHLKNQSFSAMYVFQGYNVNGETGTLTVDPADDLGPDFELETVWEKRIVTLRIGRISRIKAIHQSGGGAQQASAFLQAKPPAPAPAVATDTDKKESPPYLETFVKQLP